MVTSQMQILLVDDEKSFLELTKTFMEEEYPHFEIVTTTSAEEGLNIIEDADVDVIVSDYQMPGIDGIEFLRVLREDRGSDLPFMIFTGKGREDVAMEGLNLGADRYLQKGGDPKSQYGVLGQAIVQVIEHHRIKKELDLTSFSLQNASTGALWVSPEGEIIYANKEVCQNLGYDHDELIGMTVSDINPEYSNERPEVWKEIKRKGSTNFETFHRTKNGEIYPVEVTSHYLKKGGEEYEFAFVRDLTEWKDRIKEVREIESKLDGFLEACPDLAFLTDVDGTIAEVNEAVCQRLGLERGDLIGKSYVELRSLFSGESWRKIIENTERMLEGGSCQPFRIDVKSKDGETLFLELNSKLIEKNGEPIGLVGIGRDITERKEVMDKEEFLHSLLRHDLRNKILISEGYGELLLQADLKDRHIELLEKSMKAQRDGMELIEKVKILRQVETERRSREVNIRTVLREVFDEHKDQLGSSQIGCELETVDAMIEGGVLVKELFSNIVNNCVRHSEGSKIRIQVAKNDEWVTCSIEDDGIGISDEDKEKIFERGFKKGRSGGLGLGMYLVREIAGAYGGSVEVKDSNLGGARFDVRLKRA